MPPTVPMTAPRMPGNLGRASAPVETAADARRAVIPMRTRRGGRMVALSGWLGVNGRAGRGFHGGVDASGRLASPRARGRIRKTALGGNRAQRVAQADRVNPGDAW